MYFMVELVNCPFISKLVISPQILYLRRPMFHSISSLIRVARVSYYHYYGIKHFTLELDFCEEQRRNKTGSIVNTGHTGKSRHDTQPFYIRFCNGVDENFQHDFVINIGYCITKASITNIITV